MLIYERIIFVLLLLKYLICMHRKAKIEFRLVSKKIKLIFRFVAVVFALVAVGMHLHWIIIPTLSAYKFWLITGAFTLLFIAS